MCISVLYVCQCWAGIVNLLLRLVLEVHVQGLGTDEEKAENETETQGDDAKDVPEVARHLLVMV